MTLLPSRWFTLSLIALFPALLAAQDNPPPPDPAKPDKTLKEQSVYIPYEKLWKVFEKEGRGVFLPYEQFQELWNAAREGKTEPEPVGPPRDALVSEISGEAAVSKDVVTIRAKVLVEVLKEGWNEIPLRLDDVAVVKASLGGQPARLLYDAGQGYRLLLEKKGKQPETFTLDLEFAKSFTKSPGRNAVSFQSPLAPVSRWDIRIPEEGVKVDIRPLLAATDVPVQEKAMTHVQAFVGAAPVVTFEWTPKAEGAKGLQALASVQAEQRVWIDEGVIRTRARLDYEISRTELTELAVRVPTDHKVVNVFDQNVREWSVKADGDRQTATVQLFEPTKGKQALVVELEKYTNEAKVAAATVEAVGVSRQQGIVVVRMGAGLRAESAGQEGLLQLDAGELPPDLARERWDFSFRYAALPFALSLNVEKVQPRILVDSLVEMHVNPRELRMDLLAVYDIQRAGVFQLELDVPAGFEVRQARGIAQGEAAAQVDRHHLGEAKDGMRPLTVNLSGKAQGRTGLEVQLWRALNEPDLLTPTGKNVTIPLPVPRAKTGGVERESGRLVVYGPESLRINPAEQTGLRTIAHHEAVAGLRSTLNAAEERPALSYAFTDEPARLFVTAERRAPYITTRQLLAARIESGVAKFDATFFYEIRYSGVKSLRIDLPSAEAGQIRVITPNIRHKAIPEAEEPTGLETNMTAWSLEGETEFMGQTAIKFSWERKIDKLDIGKSVDLDIPRLIPRGVDRAWGQIVLAKAEAIDVAPAETRTGLRAIDPRQDLMPGAEVPDAAQAYEFHAEWTLAIKATRYETKEVKATSIERGLLRMVMTRGGDQSVQALYAMRSARQRLAIRLPKSVRFDTKPLRLNGRPVSLEGGEKGEFFVPLVNQDPDDLFLLELRYLVPAGGKRLESPDFPGEPAVQKVYLSAFLPEDRTYLGFRGPWNDEIGWRFNGATATPFGTRTSESLVEWVSEGLGPDLNALKNFATDGRHLLYSTLRPIAGAKGALTVKAMSTLLVNGLVLAIILLVGLLLLNRPWPRKIAWVSGLVIALLILSVFTPSLVNGLVTNGGITAGVVVVFVWILWYFLVTRPRDPGVKARRQAKLEAEAKRRQLKNRPKAGQPPAIPPPAPPAPPPAGDGKKEEGGSSHA